MEEIYKIFNYVNIKEEHQLLYVASLVVSFIPDIPHPIDVLYGDQGTAKTTTSRIKKELIDPSAMRTLTFPSTQAQFVQQSSHHSFIPLDNLTSLPEWLSDALCRTVTGEGFSKRELYTDDDDIIYNFKRCVSINGINLVPTKPDLLDRSILFELDPIAPDKKRNEVELWEDFERDKPKFLGAIFSLLSKAMKEYENVNLTRKPRMADFATWGCAVAMALGKESHDFITAYFKNMRIQNEEALEGSPVARAIIAFMEGRDSWEGSPGELLDNLDGIAESLKLNTRDKRYPKDPRWLWRRIKEVRTNLLTVGIDAYKDDSDRGSSGRKIIVKRVAQSEESREETSREERKNDVYDDMTAEHQQSQEVTTDNIPDNTEKNDVRCNFTKSLDSDNNDNTDDILEEFQGERK